MTQHDDIVRLFEKSRGHLQAVAYRMLGSKTEADDAVQEAWLKLSRSDTAGVENLKGWLTTVVARVCLDMLRSRKARSEDFVGDAVPEPPRASEEDGTAEHDLALADSVGLALLVVLETLDPPERVAFVLHDLFGVSFDEIAPIVGRNSTAARQLASRARRRVQGAPAASEPDKGRHREIVEAFLAASRGGHFDALLAVLDPDVVMRVDEVAVRTAAPRASQGAPLLAPEVRGAHAVASAFSGRAMGARPALVDGAVGAVWAPGGQPRGVFAMTFAGGKIVAIDLVADLAHIGEMDIEFLEPR